MTAYQLVRGDSYALRRPLFTYTLVDDANAPFDLSGCTVRTTWKVATTDPNVDTTDAGAVLTGTLIVDATGSATTQDGLYLVGDATAGTIEHRVSAADTLGLELNTTWSGDVELTDSNGETFTFFFDGDTISAIDGYTNRTS